MHLTQSSTDLVVSDLAVDDAAELMATVVHRPVHGLGASLERFAHTWAESASSSGQSGCCGPHGRSSRPQYAAVVVISLSFFPAPRCILVGS
eukprot:6200035-Pleurochrysis_carterae.AAC.5